MEKKLKIFFLIGIIGFIFTANLRARTYSAPPCHGIAMHGDLKYGPEDAFEYIKQDAPVGGNLRLGQQGTFDNLNPFIIKGTAPAGLNLMTDNLVFERLMVRSKDEPFSLYGLLAESVEVAPDRSWIIFNIHSEARWADGTPITSADILFSYQTLKEKGRPNMRLIYSKVKTAAPLGPLRIIFHFDKLPGQDIYDHELPLLIGLMTILPKHQLEGKDFEKVDFSKIFGSGPYQIKDVKMGHSITYQRRNHDYWGWSLTVQRGQYNFDQIRYDYYRSQNSLLEAFKAGEFDVKIETDLNHWKNSYDFPAIKNGKIKKQELKHSCPVGFKGFVFNTRNKLFADRRVRKALQYAFDFEWVNTHLLQGAFKRTNYYFANTELAPSGLPQGREKQLLERFRDQLPTEIFDQEYHPPQTDGKGNIRANLKTAKKLLEQAGWFVKNGKLINDQGKFFMVCKKWKTHK